MSTSVANDYQPTQSNANVCKDSSKYDMLLSCALLEETLRILIECRESTIGRHISTLEKGYNSQKLCKHFFGHFLDFSCSWTNKPREGVMS